MKKVEIHSTNLTDAVGRFVLNVKIEDGKIMSASLRVKSDRPGVETGGMLSGEIIKDPQDAKDLAKLFKDMDQELSKLVG